MLLKTRSDKCYGKVETIPIAGKIIGDLAFRQPVQRLVLAPVGFRDHRMGS